MYRIVQVRYRTGTSYGMGSMGTSKLLLFLEFEDTGLYRYDSLKRLIRQSLMDG